MYRYTMFRQTNLKSEQASPQASSLPASMPSSPRYRYTFNPLNPTPIFLVKAHYTLDRKPRPVNYLEKVIIYVEVVVVVVNAVVVVRITWILIPKSDG
jgi:hypothetical protein